METVYVRPTDVLVSMIGSLIDAGVEPACIYTSKDVVAHSNWQKVVRHSDLGDDYLLGMVIKYTNRNILTVVGNEVESDGTEELLTFANDEDGLPLLGVER